jgi:mRNA interferase MazF
MVKEQEVNFERGQIWYASYEDIVGSEQAMGRPALIVSNQGDIDSLNTVVVVFLTHTPKRGHGVVKVVHDGKASYILCNQMRTLDKRRFINLMTKLNDADMKRVNNALKLTLGVNGVNIDENRVEKLESEIEDLKLELKVQEKLYERALDKIVELRFEKDVQCATPKAKVEVPKVETPPIQVDVEELKENMGAISEKKKTSRPTVEDSVESDKPEKVNINTDNWEVIAATTGMGVQTAQSIVRYRKKHGEFIDLVDLLNVPRFGIRNMDKYGNMLEV